MIHRFPENLLHENRRRAESFGALAADYDELRPSYPDALVEFVCPSGGAEILDIGTGTGKAARRFIERGCDVLGLEIDPRMAEVARSHGLAVEISSFEEWDPRGRTFDIVTAGQSWHWIDPSVGARKAVEVLHRGGRLIAFWNYGHPRDPDVEASIERAFAETTPELAWDEGSKDAWRNDDDTVRRQEQLEASGCFAQVERLTFPWVWQMSPAHFLRLQFTHSEVSVLPDDRRRALFRRLEDALASFDQDLVFDYVTICFAATTE